MGLPVVQTPVAEQAPPDPSTSRFLVRVGQQIRLRRKELDLTVQELADRAGISRRMLTQIELGQANPSLITVDSVARALNTDFVSLARDDSPDRLLVNDPDDAVVVWSSALGSRAVLHVATTCHPPAELWTWTLEPSDIYQAEADPSGSEELFVVLSGRLTVCAEGMDSVTLPVGASARLSTDLRYRYENRTSRPVRFVRVAQVN
jgi:transcriptional regulator with XRE-family HTH domain